MMPGGPPRVVGPRSPGLPSGGAWPVICPFCSANDDKVIDSRASEGGRVIRRRRECLHCQKRFTTYERVEQTARLIVIKKDGTRVPFNSENIYRGVASACGKRPIPESVKRQMVEAIDEELHREFDREVPSTVIGDRVMLKLREVDQVAYIRFASEYQQFRSVDDLMEELKLLREAPKDVRNQQNLFSENSKGK